MCFGQSGEMVEWIQIKWLWVKALLQSVTVVFLKYEFGSQKLKQNNTNIKCQVAFPPDLVLL